MTRTRIETLCFRITARCNLACSFCRAGSSPSAHDYADVEAFKRFVTDMQGSLGLRHVSISGGEPGIDPRLAELVTWLTGRNLYVSVTTNGTSLVSKKLETVRDAHPRRIRVRVSLDGDRSLHERLRGAGMHAVAIKEARRIKERFGWLGINTIVGEDFVRRRLRAESVLQDLSVDEWALITPVPQGSAEGQPWSVQDVLPPIIELRENTLARGFNGDIVIWNFLGTPNTSLLVTARDELVLAGVRGDDDVQLGSLTEYNMDFIQRAVREATESHPRVHFSWRRWAQG